MVVVVLDGYIDGVSLCLDSKFDSISCKIVCNGEQGDSVSSNFVSWWTWSRPFLLCSVWPRLIDWFTNNTCITSLLSVVFCSFDPSLFYGSRKWWTVWPFSPSDLWNSSHSNLKLFSLRWIDHPFFSWIMQLLLPWSWNYRLEWVISEVCTTIGE